MRHAVRRFGRSLLPGAVLLSVLGVIPIAARAQTFSLSIGGASYDFGRGRITSTPAGIDCTFRDRVGQPPTGTCGAQFPAGSTVTLTVTVFDGSTFERWIGYGCDANPNPVCTLTMTQNFGGFVGIKPLRYPVTIVGAGNGTGTVRNVELFAQPALACRITRGVAAPSFCATTDRLAAP